MAENKPKAPVQFVRGFPCPFSPLFTAKKIEDAMDLVPEDDDLILVSYPKTGTTWVNYILLQVRSKGQYFPSFEDVTYKRTPFLEMAGVDAVLAQDKPRFYKHHIAYDYVQKNPKSKYVYTYRHPEDTVVSFYHFSRSVLPDFALDFDVFFDNFVTGNIGYGNYFQHVLSFYEHRNDDNLLMVSFEKLHANRKCEILRIAKFLGEEYYRSLAEEEETLEKIIERTSFDYMKKNLHLTNPHVKSENQNESKPVNFFRKGVVGDGKTELTDAQRQRIREAAEKVLKGTSIIDEWYSTVQVMSEEEQTFPLLIVRGLPFPLSPLFTAKNIEDAMDLVPEDDDLVLASYPKTGTTWMNYILLQIRSRGQNFPTFEEVAYRGTPFLEASGVAPVLAQDKPRFYKHHIPYNYVQRNPKSKYVYTYRHPEDTIVSFYHFSRSVLPDFALDFDVFFDNFVTGNIGYGNYFQHVLSFYDHRNDDNLLMVSYEKLHANRKDEILRIAKFLGEEYYRSLLEDEEILEKIIERTSFDYMKKNIPVANPNVKTGSETESKHLVFFRKGVVGDGKTELTDAQRQRIREAAEKVLKGTSILDEWYSS